MWHFANRILVVTSEAIQVQLYLPSFAGWCLLVFYVTVFNRFPTIGRQLFRQNRFRYFHAPALFITTIGFLLGFVIRQT